MISKWFFTPKYLSGGVRNTLTINLNAKCLKSQFILHFDVATNSVNKTDTVNTFKQYA